jgi:hypothetical protein
MTSQVHSSIDVKAGELMHSITVTVSGLKGVQLRLAIARQIFRFGAWVAGFNIIVE